MRTTVDISVTQHARLDAVLIVYAIGKYGVRKNIVSSSSNEAHWLDITDNKYSKTEVSDTKAALEVLYTYIAYPVFWALYEQQVSHRSPYTNGMYFH